MKYGYRCSQIFAAQSKSIIMSRCCWLLDGGNAACTLSHPHHSHQLECTYSCEVDVNMLSFLLYCCDTLSILLHVVMWYMAPLCSNFVDHTSLSSRYTSTAVFLSTCTFDATSVTGYYHIQIWLYILNDMCVGCRLRRFRTDTAFFLFAVLCALRCWMTTISAFLMLTFGSLISSCFTVLTSPIPSICYTFFHTLWQGNSSSIEEVVGLGLSQT